MYINRLAGRTLGDPAASAILPWVTDFSSPNGGLRDLTKTKFRLTKGERQLDATYGDGKRHWRQPSEANKPSHYPAAQGDRQQIMELFVPHHLLDMMPNLAYYTYKVSFSSHDNEI